MKDKFKNKAIMLRKNGLSYTEILENVPVAKSTLSLWLRSVSLTRQQKQRLTGKKLKASHLGGIVKRKNRQILANKIINESKKQIKSFSKNELFLVGVTLYWAEGAKQKETNPSQGIVFANSDAKMIKVFLKFVREYLNIQENDIIFEIYIHESNKSRTEQIKTFWSGETGFCIGKFDRIYYKFNKSNTLRKNIGDNYFGLLRIKVRRSTNLNRRICGWTEGICKQCGVV